MFNTREVAVLTETLKEKLFGGYDKLRELSYEQTHNVDNQLNKTKIDNLTRELTEINLIIIKILKLGA